LDKNEFQLSVTPSDHPLRDVEQAVQNESQKEEGQAASFEVPNTQFNTVTPLKELKSDSNPNLVASAPPAAHFQPFQQHSEVSHKTS
jgi:hypothetical protein